MLSEPLQTQDKVLPILCVLPDHLFQCGDLGLIDLGGFIENILESLCHQFDRLETFRFGNQFRCET